MVVYSYQFHISCECTPTRLAVLSLFQVCLEGEISRESIMSSLSRGKRAAGDLIPWTISQQVGDAIVRETLAAAKILFCQKPSDYETSCGGINWFVYSFKSLVRTQMIQNFVFSLFQFQDNDFGTLSGARVVRIATHPDYTGVRLLTAFLLFSFFSIYRLLFYIILIIVSIILCCTVPLGRLCTRTHDTL